MAEQITYKDSPWLNNYEKGVPATIEYEEIILPESLTRSAEKYPDHTALVFQGYIITYRELEDMVNKFAACLYNFGIRKGDSVSVHLPNLIPCVIVFYAILRLGAIAVMNNPLYSDRELKHQFNDSNSKLLITLDLLANRMIDLRPETGIKEIIYTSIGDYLPFPKNILFKIFGRMKKLAANVKHAENVLKFKELMNSSYPGGYPDFPKAEVSFEDTAIYQYTGGTTGVSKGVILTHANLSRQVQQVKAWLPQFEEGNVVNLGALPFFHVFGLTVCMNLSIYMAWQNVLVPKPQAKELIEAIEQFKPTFAALVPTMYIGILNHPGLDKVDLTSIKGCFSGSAPLPIEVIKEFEEKTGAVIVEGFGLTESSPVTHINPYADGERKIGSIGLPIPDTKCKIVDINDGETDIPVGETGELLIKGPQVMSGYWNKKEDTEATITDGWLHTGDIAKMDENGYFYIVDRKKDMILSGGYNVYPRDIEEVLYEHPDILEAAVIGIPHETRGEAAKVFAVTKDGKNLSQKDLIEYCKGKLAKYKLPTKVEFRAELPKSTVGKILKKDLKKEEAEKREKKNNQGL